MGEGGGGLLANIRVKISPANLRLTEEIFILFYILQFILGIVGYELLPAPSGNLTSLLLLR